MAPISRLLACFPIAHLPALRLAVTFTTRSTFILPSTISQRHEMHKTPTTSKTARGGLPADGAGLPAAGVGDGLLGEAALHGPLLRTLLRPQQNAQKRHGAGTNKIQCRASHILVGFVDLDLTPLDLCLPALINWSSLAIGQNGVRKIVQLNPGVRLRGTPCISAHSCDKCVQIFPTT